MKIKFNTREYIISNGTNPKGCGSWFFEVEAVDGFEVEEKTKTWYSPWMTYGQAKFWVKEEVKAWTAKKNISAHHVCVKVGP